MSSISVPTDIIDEFKSSVSPDLPVPIAAAKTLLGVISRSKAVTLMGLEAEVKGKGD